MIPVCMEFMHVSLQRPGIGASAIQQGDDTFKCDQFIAGVLRELSVCLSETNNPDTHS
jgi:hypothetical protein